MGTAQSRGVYGSIGSDLGLTDYLDGKRYGTNGKIGWHPSSSLSMELGGNFRWYELKDGEFETIIVDGSIRFTPTKKIGVKLKKDPSIPSNYELKEIGRMFPPNFLHKSWSDFLYWDSELESD